MSKSLEQRLDEIVKEAREAGYAITYWSPEELEEFPGADAAEMIDLAVQRGNDYLEDFRVDDDSEVITYSVCLDCAEAIGAGDLKTLTPHLDRELNGRQGVINLLGDEEDGFDENTAAYSSHYCELCNSTVGGERVAAALVFTPDEEDEPCL